MSILVTVWSRKLNMVLSIENTISAINSISKKYTTEKETRKQPKILSISIAIYI
jgi:hypothetical protein